MILPNVGCFAANPLRNPLDEPDASLLTEYVAALLGREVEMRDASTGELAKFRLYRAGTRDSGPAQPGPRGTAEVARAIQSRMIVVAVYRSDPAYTRGGAPGWYDYATVRDDADSLRFVQRMATTAGVWRHR